LANGGHRKSVASIQIAGHTHRWHEAKILYISLISHVFPCPAGQVLFQKKIVLFRSEGPRGFSMAFWHPGVSCGWFQGGKTMLTETREKKST
jgi:hypothetical protein